MLVRIAERGYWENFLELKSCRLKMPDYLLKYKKMLQANFSAG